MRVKMALNWVFEKLELVAKFSSQTSQQNAKQQTKMATTATAFVG
jgi:hypothetical protein